MREAAADVIILIQETKGTKELDEFDSVVHGYIAKLAKRISRPTGRWYSA